jgi:SAM-dependent methyltransferase
MTTTEFILKKFGKENYVGKMPIHLDCLRDDLAGIFCELGLNVGVEIGVAAGRFSEILLGGHPNLKLYCIDPYLSYPGYLDFPIQEKLTNFETCAKEKLAHYGDRVQFIKKPSMAAVKDFEDNSLDFVYIDGNHLFRAVADDLEEWGKKVRPGGIIAGHDFETHKKPAIINVKEVVCAWTYAFAISPWFVTTRMRRYPQDGNIARSFFWEKK